MFEDSVFDIGEAQRHPIARRTFAPFDTRRIDILAGSLLDQLPQNHTPSAPTFGKGIEAASVAASIRAVSMVILEPGFVVMSFVFLWAP